MKSANAKVLTALVVASAAVLMACGGDASGPEIGARPRTARTRRSFLSPPMKSGRCHCQWTTTWAAPWSYIFHSLVDPPAGWRLQL